MPSGRVYVRASASNSYKSEFRLFIPLKILVLWIEYVMFCLVSIHFYSAVHKNESDLLHKNEVTCSTGLWALSPQETTYREFWKSRMSWKC